MLGKSRQGCITRHRVECCLLLVIAVFAQPCVASDVAETPAQVVTRLQSGLIGIMKEADSLGYSGRYQRLQPLLTSTHDLDIIGQIAIRRHWKMLDDVQRADYLDTFRKLTVATYASRFNRFNDQYFGLLDQKALSHGRHLVKTQLTRKNSEPVQLDYILHLSGGRWRIINIIADGVSDLAIKRSQYNAVMNDHDLEYLLDKLQQKIDDYAADIH
ncbi:MAG: ABC transporter substrate-binding protein [Pseudomonadota bacterium]